MVSGHGLRSRRLSVLAAQVIPGLTMADIGTDHATLPIALLEAGIVPMAIASDVRSGPLAQAQANAGRSRCSSRLSLRLGDGLTVLSPGEVGTVVMSGMGGATIVDALERSGDALAGVQRLVLQPQGAEARIRQWVHEQRWHLRSEQWIQDQGLMYLVLTAEPRRRYEQFMVSRWIGRALNVQTVYALGPLFLRYPTPMALYGAEAYAESIRGTIAQLQRAVHPDGHSKRQKMQEHLKEVEEVIEKWMRPYVQSSIGWM